MFSYYFNFSSFSFYIFNKCSSLFLILLYLVFRFRIFTMLNATFIYTITIHILHLCNWWIDATFVSFHKETENISACYKIYIYQLIVPQLHQPVQNQILAIVQHSMAAYDEHSPNPMESQFKVISVPKSNVVTGNSGLSGYCACQIENAGENVA